MTKWSIDRRLKEILPPCPKTLPTQNKVSLARRSISEITYDLFDDDVGIKLLFKTQFAATFHSKARVVSVSFRTSSRDQL